MRTLTCALAFFACAMSAALFAAMGADKHYAKSPHRRVPEKRLFLLALLGGAPGGLLGMYAFRHKTKHWYFVWGFWALTLLELAALSFLAYRYM